ncbi:MAG: hypothetical protein K6F05_09515 [Succinivibrio sp.]|nr:hypothetical protein [Succinivibrio sp.]
MLVRLWKIPALLGLFILFYVLSVLLTGVYAEKVLNLSLNSANSYLASHKNILGAPLSLSYVRTSKTLLQESGELQVTNQATSQTVKLPTTVDYGCLTLSGDVNLYHFLNNLFLRKGILDLTSESHASFRLRLLTQTGSLLLRLEGGYTQDYLKQDFKHLFGYAKRLEATLRLHQQPLGTLVSELEINHLAHRNFTAEHLLVQGVNAQDPGFKDSRMYFNLQGLFAHGTIFDDLNDLEVSLNPMSDPALDQLRLGVTARLNSTRGSMDTEFELGALSLKSLEEQQADLCALLIKPLSFNRFSRDAEVTGKLQNLTFNADYPGYQGRVCYEAQAQGELKIPKDNSFVSTLDKLKGRFKVEFSRLNEAGSAVVESLGDGYVTRRGNRLVSDVVISDGNILLNGKEYR